MLGWMCPDGTQCRQGSPDTPDATRCGVLVQDAQEVQDAGSRLGESGHNTTGSDTGHLFADVNPCSDISGARLVCEHWGVGTVSYLVIVVLLIMQILHSAW